MNSPNPDPAHVLDDGFSDILVETDDLDAGLMIEVKYSPTLEGLEDACTRAMA